MNLNNHYPFELEPLPYAYDALEPYINSETLHFHHDKHLKTYIDNLNKILEPHPQYHNWSLIKLLLNICSLPEAIQTPVRNNAGGVFNHELYFNSMTSPKENNKPTEELLEVINSKFGSYDNFKKALLNCAVSQFGSGYGWLVVNANDGLEVINTPNQNTPISVNQYPLLPVDVWEHAYYLQYQNRRPDYVDNWFKLIDWDWINSVYIENK